MPDKTRSLVALGLAGASLVLLYWPVLAGLAHDWATDDNYSHGFVILPFAAYFAWERRRTIATIHPEPTITGLCLVLVGLALLMVGRLGADFFMARASLLVVLPGALAFVWGWALIRALMFPLAFLLLMIPLPTIVFNQIAFPLQLVASWVGEIVLSSLRIPVLREGNLIVLAKTTLEVAEACSGIRSLISLMTLGVVYGYFLDERTWVRTAIVVSTVPIAILTNGLRVAGTGVAAHYIGDQAAQGFFHVFSGWMVFLVAFLLLFAVTAAILRALPPRPLPAAAAPLREG